MRTPDEILAEIHKLMSRLDKLTEPEQPSGDEDLQLGKQAKTTGKQRDETEERLRDLFREYIDVVFKRQGEGGRISE